MSTAAHCIQACLIDPLLWPNCYFLYGRIQTMNGSLVLYQITWNWIGSNQDVFLSRRRNHNFHTDSFHRILSVFFVLSWELLTELVCWMWPMTLFSLFWKGVCVKVSLYSGKFCESGTENKSRNESEQTTNTTHVYLTTLDISYQLLLCRHHRKNKWSAIRLKLNTDRNHQKSSEYQLNLLLLVILILQDIYLLQVICLSTFWFGCHFYLSNI